MEIAIPKTLIKSVKTLLDNVLLTHLRFVNIHKLKVVLAIKPSMKPALKQILALLTHYQGGFYVVTAHLIQSVPNVW